MFILIGNAPHRELATNLVQTMPRIIEFLGSHQVPFIAKVYRPSPVEAVQAGRSGKVSLWLDQPRWEKALEHGG